MDTNQLVGSSPQIRTVLSVIAEIPSTEAFQPRTAHFWVTLPAQGSKYGSLISKALVEAMQEFQVITSAKIPLRYICSITP